MTNLKTLALGLFLVAVSASASATVYLNRMDWEAAAALVGSPISTETFSTAVGQLPAGNTVYNALNINVSGVSNSGTNISGGVLNGFIVANQVASITVSFAAPVRGFGMELTSPTTGDQLVVSSVGVNTYNISSYYPSQGGTVFFGVIEDSFLTQMKFTTQNSSGFGEAFAVDNLSSVVPEPGTMVALALGASVLASRRRRK